MAVQVCAGCLMRLLLLACVWWRSGSFSLAPLPLQLVLYTITNSDLHAMSRLSWAGLRHSRLLDLACVVLSSGTRRCWCATFLGSPVSSGPPTCCLLFAIQLVSEYASVCDSCLLELVWAKTWSSFVDSFQSNCENNWRHQSRSLHAPQTSRSQATIHLVDHWAGRQQEAKAQWLRRQQRHLQVKPS